MSEYIHQGDGKLREIKAASGRRSGFSWILFRRPFHPDCIYGESLHLGEVGRRIWPSFCRCFSAPFTPPLDRESNSECLPSRSTKIGQLGTSCREAVLGSSCLLLPSLYLLMTVSGLLDARHKPASA